MLEDHIDNWDQISSSTNVLVVDGVEYTVNVFVNPEVETYIAGDPVTSDLGTELSSAKTSNNGFTLMEYRTNGNEVNIRLSAYVNSTRVGASFRSTLFSEITHIDDALTSIYGYDKYTLRSSIKLYGKHGTNYATRAYKKAWNDYTIFKRHPHSSPYRRSLSKIQMK